MALLISSTLAVLFFFSYRTRLDIYVDAIVTEFIDITNNVNNDALVAFLVRYVKHLKNFGIKNSELVLHPKDSYKVFLKPLEDEVKHIRSSLCEQLTKERQKYLEETSSETSSQFLRHCMELKYQYSTLTV